MTLRTSLLLAAILLTASTCFGAVRTAWIDYEHEGVTLSGYAAWDDAVTGKRPGVVVVHEWKGLGEHSRRSAERLAAMGYVGFALDMYGKGVLLETNEEAAQWAKRFKDDRALMRSRADAGLAVLAGRELVDAARVAALGYCFGGTVVLEMARAGQPLKAAVSFHGGLATPDPADAKNIRCPVLALHGADDPYVKHDEVAAFVREMREAQVDWQLAHFGGAAHSFTNPAANSQGARYDPAAARRSWAYCAVLLEEVFE